MYAMATAGSATPEHLILWDVVEEHFDEATFLVEQFESLLNHPVLTLADLERTVESRLLAHLDGLVVGGLSLAERLLIPALTQIGEDGAARITAATLALILGRNYEPVCAALLHESETIQRAVLRGCLLARSAEVERWALDTFSRSQSSRTRAVLMPLIGAQLDERTLVHCLESEDPSLVVVAVQVVSRGAPKNFAPKMAQLLNQEDVRVQDAALMAGLAWGVPQAWTTLRQRALGPEPNADLLALYAMLSNPSPHPALIDLLSRPTHRYAALFALGFCGSPEAIPVLIEQIKQTQESDLLAAKFAMQSIALLTGMDLNTHSVPQPRSDDSESSDEPEARAALPPFELDDLAANLVGIPEETLPLPNAAGIERFWQEAPTQFQRDERYLRGKPFSKQASLDALQNGPLRVRHVLAWGLAVQTGGGWWVETKELVRNQRQTMVVQ